MTGIVQGRQQQPTPLQQQACTAEWVTHLKENITQFKQADRKYHCFSPMTEQLSLLTEKVPKQNSDAGHTAQTSSNGTAYLVATGTLRK